MKKVLFAVAAVLVLLIGAALVAPSFIDWTRHRDAIAAELERAIGRRVVIAGAVDAALLPTPRLVLNDTRLGNLPGAASPEMARLRSLEARVEFWPLLSGRIVVESFVLREPVVTLEVLADGRRNWSFEPAGPGQRAAEPQGLPLQSVELKNAAIVNGTVFYRDARSGHEERVDGFNARIVAESLAGPFRVAGEMRAGGKPLRLRVATGRFDPRGIALTPINAAVDLVNAGGSETRATLAFNGSAQVAPALRATGKARLSGPDFAIALAALGPVGELPGFLGQSFSVEGGLTLNTQRAELNGLVVQLGDIRTQGAINAVFVGPRDGKPQIDVALVMGYLDLDTWLAMPSRPATSKTPPPFALPKSVRVTLDASAEAIAYRKGLLRQIKLSAEMVDGGFVLRQSSAQIPGGTDAVVSGALTLGEAPARFAGRADLASDDFRTLLAWVGIDAKSLPAGRLNKITATANLAAAVDTLEVSDLDARFDATRVTGGIVAALRARPAFGVNLTADQLNLDAYLPIEADDKAGVQLDWLDNFDANVLLRAGQLTWRATPMREFALDGTLASGGATLRRLAGQAGDGAFAVSGTVADLAGARSFGLDVDIAAKDPESLYRLIGIAPPPFAAAGPLKMTGRVDGDAKGYRSPKFELALGPLSVAGEGALALSAARPKLIAKLSTGEIDTDVFLDDGAPSRAGWSRTPYALAGLALVDAELSLAGKALIHDGLRIDSPTAVINLANGALDLASFTGHLSGGSVKARGGLASTGGKAALTGSLSLAGVDIKQWLNSRQIDLVGAKLDAEADFAGEGADEAAVIASLSGKGRVALTGGMLRGIDLAAVNRRLGAIERPGDAIGLIRSAASGMTRLTSLSGTFAADDGILVSSDLALTLDGAAGQGEMQIDLPKRRLEAAADFRLADHPQAPPLQMTVAGPWEAPDKGFATEGLVAYVLERAAQAAPPPAPSAPVVTPPPPVAAPASEPPAAPRPAPPPVRSAAPPRPVPQAQIPSPAAPAPKPAPAPSAATQSAPVEDSASPATDAFIRDVLRSLGP